MYRERSGVYIINKVPEWKIGRHPDDAREGLTEEMLHKACSLDVNIGECVLLPRALKVQLR